MMTCPRLPAMVAAVGALMPAMALAQGAVAPEAPHAAPKSSLRLWDMLIAGGPPIIPIAICSFVPVGTISPQPDIAEQCTQS